VSNAVLSILCFIAVWLLSVGLFIRTTGPFKSLAALAFKVAPMVMGFLLGLIAFGVLK
jgi:hypothetical protein